MNTGTVKFYNGQKDDVLSENAFCRTAPSVRLSLRPIDFAAGFNKRSEQT